MKRGELRLIMNWRSNSTAVTFSQNSRDFNPATEQPEKPLHLAHEM